MAKTCSLPGCAYFVFAKNFCKYHQSHRTDKPVRKPKQQKPIRKVSKKREVENREYAKLRKKFFENPGNIFCAVFPHLLATEIHHTRGRGKYLNDVSTWLAVSREGHIWIHENVKLATERGFMKSRLQLITPLNEE